MAMTSSQRKSYAPSKARSEHFYEDEDLLVIDKPAGLLVIPDRWDASKPTVVKLARAYLHTGSR